MTNIFIEDDVIEQLASLIVTKMKAKDVMSVQEAADYLGIGRDRVDLLISTGRIRSKNLGQGERSYHRIRKEWLDQYMEEEK